MRMGGHAFMHLQRRLCACQPQRHDIAIYSHTWCGRFAAAGAACCMLPPPPSAADRIIGRRWQQRRWQGAASIIPR